MVKKKVAEHRDDKQPIGYAFWKYVTFPYLLGSPVTEVNDNGSVYAPAYQRWFHPVLLVSMKRGEELRARLEKLTGEYQQASQALNADFAARLAVEIPDIDESQF